LPAPEPWRILVGSPALEVRAPGYYTVSRTVVINPDATTRESVELVKKPAEEARPGIGGSGQQTGARTEDSASGSPQRTIGFAMLGAAGVGAAIGIIGAVISQNAVTSYNDNLACPGDSTPSENQSPECADKLSSGKTWRQVETVGFIAAGAFAVGGVVLVLTAPRGAKAAPRAAQSLAVRSDGQTSLMQWRAKF
jgi:hypothetical protein